MSIVGLIDYGKSGNLFNVRKAIEIAGARVEIIKSSADFDKVDKLVLPGVGNFRDAIGSMGTMKKSLIENINKKPTLGICLGMQILAKLGFEGGETEGLNLIDAEVKMMEVKGKVPHLGWGSLEMHRKCPILEGTSPGDLFYFMHSYEMVNYTNVIALTEYSHHKFVSVVQKENVFGVQFHPEKSRESGIKILKNFISL